MTHSDRNTPSAAEAVAIGRHVTWVGFWINAVLAAAKIVGGIVGRSSALIADGIHSLSDFLSDIIVIIMVGVSRRRPDASHAFGHGRYESLATIILALALAGASVFLFYEGLTKVIDVARGATLPRPLGITLIILVISVLAKEWLYHYTRRAGERIRSQAVVANAWHHRSDALSSIATLVGVAGAIFLGPQWRILDPIAAMLVALFIIIVAVKMLAQPLAELLGASLSQPLRHDIEQAINATPGVKTWHALRTFKSGNDAYIEVHLKVDPDITVRQAHDIATDAERRIRAAIPDMSVHPTTHIEPA